jgi:hypothetical protein
MKNTIKRLTITIEILILACFEIHIKTKLNYIWQKEKN